MVSGPETTLLRSQYPGRAKVLLFLCKIQPTAYIRIAKPSRGATDEMALG